MKRIVELVIVAIVAAVVAVGVYKALEPAQVPERPGPLAPIVVPAPTPPAQAPAPVYQAPPWPPRSLPQGPQAPLPTRVPLPDRDDPVWPDGKITPPGGR
jgi:hypothetical protein